jgi:hypothetical protein
MNLELFQTEQTRPESEAILAMLLECLTAANQMYLRAHPSTPPLYSSGVRYMREPPGEEEWNTIPVCLAEWSHGRGSDCEDLACWRVAELRAAGIPASPVFYFRRRAQLSIYHIVVRLPDGRIEDPSSKLGMLNVV